MPEGGTREQHTIVWWGITVEITFTPEKFGMADHVELRTEDRAPLPVTETTCRACHSLRLRSDASGDRMSLGIAYFRQKPSDVAGQPIPAFHLGIDLPRCGSPFQTFATIAKQT